MNKHWQKLQSRLFSKPLYLQARASVSQGVHIGQQSLWVISRSLCIFRVLDLGKVPDKHRQAALAQQVKLMSPFKSCGFRVVWQQGRAVLWLWNAESLSASMAEQGLSAEAQKNVDVLPESVFTEEQSNGLYTYQGLDGVIAQFWRDGQLKNEAYWAAPPSGSDWDSFVRSASLAPTERPALQRIEYLSPWQIRTQSSLMAKEKQIAQVGLSIFLLIILFQGVGIARAAWASHALSAEIAALKIEMSGVIRVREQLFDLRAINQDLRQHGSAKQLVLMAAIVQALPATATEIVDWHFQGQKIELIVEDTSADLLKYIRSLEELPEVRDVSAEPVSRKGQIKVSMVVS